MISLNVTAVNEMINVDPAEAFASRRGSHLVFQEDDYVHGSTFVECISSFDF